MLDITIKQIRYVDFQRNYSLFHVINWFLGFLIIQILLLPVIQKITIVDQLNHICLMIVAEVN